MLKIPVIEFHNLNDLLITNKSQNLIEIEDVINLPPHHRCVSHLLNLIAVKDSEKAIENNLLYKKQYRGIRQVENLIPLKTVEQTKQSTQVADKIEELCGVYLKTPVVQGKKIFYYIYICKYKFFFQIIKLFF